ncbi:hypothetical protein LMG7053_03303 [Achromobacter ruhlandii]|uniref:Transposase n=1 Tax=Achromobacter ruhlandii TaxID=72557 RepID=A0ABM8LXA9_9BURK|nr:hypothetical protein Axylo_3205 [Achromobacter xylosoxidans]CAB3950886.1 hypothetical protein LMG7053_03303 [Achromobacter ruhlandii]
MRRPHGPIIAAHGIYFVDIILEIIPETVI